jgi:hypothetical protein
MHSGFFVLCLWSDQSEVVGGFFFFVFLNLVVNFKFFCCLFPVTAFELDLFSGACLNKFTVPMVSDD